MSVINYIVRRGIDHSSSNSRPDGNYEFEMSSWGKFSLIVTFITFFLALYAVEYTYGNVIATLTMVESTTATAYITSQNDDTDDINEKKVLQEEVVVAVQEPLTSSFRRTLKLLREKGGRLSRFRGLPIYFIYYCLFSNLTGLFSLIPHLPQGVDRVLATICLARLGTAWTHTVISEPSTKYWFQRIPSIKVWNSVFLPTAIFAISEQLSIGLPIYLYRAFHLHRTGPQEWFSEMDNTDRQLVVCKLFAVIAVYLFAKIAIVIPASVSLTRIQASLLPEDEKSIVSFDRSFGGLIPRAEWSTTAIGMLDAWKTFNWNSRFRLIKLYIKVDAMQISLMVLFSAVLLVQVYFFASEDIVNILLFGSGIAHNALNAN